jgi:hypothetical protein
MWSKSLRTKAYSSAKHVALASVLAVVAGCASQATQGGAATAEGGVVHDQSGDSVTVDRPYRQHRAPATERQHGHSAATMVDSWSSSADLATSGAANPRRAPGSAPSPPVPPVCHLCP